LIITFLAANGWTPAASPDSFLIDNESMTETDAVALAEAGKRTFAGLLKNPMRTTHLRFDLEKFSAIVDFASGGGFKITRLQ
jgi:hypothetical protein